MMTAAQIRQSYLDFFKSKQHTIVPSSSLMPDSPGLLFTNAGMNQFVPIFLGQIECPYKPGRAADTQKCIRAGGKHNDLDDVGLDTYHHTFFEMLGNWSFGDYFKKEAISWAWELIIDVWKFPAERVYTSIYQPGPGDPAERDQEAWDLWAEKFRSVGLDPDIHIVNGNKKDNFWMMGATGPCGPCTEIHVDLRPGPVRTTIEQQKAGALLVNGPTPAVIEIWNNVFIQYNAQPDGPEEEAKFHAKQDDFRARFDALPAQHVDTGMGFERVVSIIHGTKNFTDFENAQISNYNTDVFRPIFTEIEKLSGQTYTASMPTGVRIVKVEDKEKGTVSEKEVVYAVTEEEAKDVAFRVIADHIRTLSFSIADGIEPGNNGRHYVLRRILRRAVRYGRNLGFKGPFFWKLVAVLSETMGDVFPEIRARRKAVEEVLKREEESFLRTLEKGVAIFEAEVSRLAATNETTVSGAFAFKLSDEQGFPIDLTELMARENGLAVDGVEFERLLAEQRKRGEQSGTRQIVDVSQIETKTATRFLGYDADSTAAKVLEVISMVDPKTKKPQMGVILDTTTAYAEMGGQLGDAGTLITPAATYSVLTTQKNGDTFLHIVDGEDAPSVGTEILVEIDRARRAAMSRHHSVTHILHWALHEVVSRDATQKGSYVGPEKLTFDFNSGALTPQQITDIERLVNERILENDPISWMEVKHRQVQGREDIMQAFGEKYGEWVRVVQIGGQPTSLNGYSMELCGGTHVRGTGEIGLFRIVGEAATGAGIRRIEAVAGLAAYEAAALDISRLKGLAGRLGAPLPDIEKKLDGMLAQQKELEKKLEALQKRQATATAKDLVAKAQTIGGVPAIIADLGDQDGDALQTIANTLAGGLFQGVVVIGGVSAGNVALIAAVTPDFTSKAQAGKIIQQIAPIVGGKGGGRPDNARGGGKDAAKLGEALEAARKLLG